MSIIKVQNNNNQGNPYHKTSDGQFTSKDGTSEARQASELFGFKNKLSGSKTAVPRMTSSGIPRKFCNEDDEYKNSLYKQFYSYEGIAKTTVQINNLGEEPTNLDNSEVRVALRKKILQDVIQEQEQSNGIKRENKAFIVLGLPASGKSTIAEPLAKQFGCYEIDPDIMKEHIPEYQENTINVSKVHKESVDLAAQMFSNITSTNSNVVIGKVGGYTKDILKLKDELVKKGYKINVILVDTPADECINRAISRYSKTGRLVPPQIITQSDGKIFDTYDELMKDSNVIGGAIYSNDVAENESPKLLKIDKDGKKEMNIND